MKKCIFLFTMLAFLCGLPMSAQAAFVTSKINLQVEQYSKAKFTAVSDPKTGSTVVTADTKGLPQGYYTAYIYQDKWADLRSYSGILMTLSNASPNEATFSLQLGESAAKYATMKKLAPYTQIKNGAKYPYIAEDGYIRLPASTTEQIYIPITSLDLSAGVNLANIHRYGFLVTIAQNQTCALTISGLQILTPAQAAGYASGWGSAIIGPASMQIAVQGESIAEFTVQTENGKTSSYQFQPLEGISGVRLESDGRLVSTDQAKEQTITITAKDATGNVLTHEVKLYLSWRASKDTVENQRFLTPEEMQKPNASFQKYFSGIYLLVIRIVALLVSCLLLAAYFIARQQKKKNDSQRI